VRFDLRGAAMGGRFVIFDSDVALMQLASFSRF
jgi:hypothetical protein